jgi:hypothetical protein
VELVRQSSKYNLAANWNWVFPSLSFFSPFNRVAVSGWTDDWFGQFCFHVIGPKFEKDCWFWPSCFV